MIFLLRTEDLTEQQRGLKALACSITNAQRRHPTAFGNGSTCQWKGMTMNGVWHAIFPHRGVVDSGIAIGLRSLGDGGIDGSGGVERGVQAGSCSSKPG